MSPYRQAWRGESSRTVPERPQAVDLLLLFVIVALLLIGAHH
jgi:hypothetical protein